MFGFVFEWRDRRQIIDRAQDEPERRSGRRADRTEPKKPSRSPDAPAPRALRPPWSRPVHLVDRPIPDIDSV